MNNFLKSWPETVTNQKDTHAWSCKCLIFLEIPPSLTTSKEGLKTLNIHLKKQGFNYELGCQFISAINWTKSQAFPVWKKSPMKR
jgi:hypothetical protein